MLTAVHRWAAIPKTTAHFLQQSGPLFHHLSIRNGFNTTDFIPCRLTVDMAPGLYLFLADHFVNYILLTSIDRLQDLILMLSPNFQDYLPNYVLWYGSILGQKLG